MKLSALSRMSMEANPCLRWVIEISTDRQLLPRQVNVTLNFGDGTGEQVWSREDPKHLWVHQYQMPGFYWVSVSSGLPIILTFQNVKSYIPYRLVSFGLLTHCCPQLAMFTTWRGTTWGWRWRLSTPSWTTWEWRWCTISAGIVLDQRSHWLKKTTTYTDYQKLSLCKKISHKSHQPDMKLQINGVGHSVWFCIHCFAALCV